MLVELDHKGLRKLVHGSVPLPDVFENNLIKKCGYYNGNKWLWNEDELGKCTEEQLHLIIEMCPDKY